MICICGRKVKVKTGSISQTVNVCGSANIHGEYDYIIRLRPPFISEETLLVQKFTSIDDLVRYVERSHFGVTEKRPVMESSISVHSRSYMASQEQIDPQTTASPTFRDWRDRWDELGKTDGRIDEVLALWAAPIPGSWMRSAVDIPGRLLKKDDRYTRGDRDRPRRGEHEIEHEILVSRFDRITCLGRPLLDGVNAYPLVKDSLGARNDNVEADLALLVGPPDAPSILVADVKKTDGNPWTALIQNLRQLRLYMANPTCGAFFNRRSVKTCASEIRGAVIAPETFYAARGKKANNLAYARQLSETMLRVYRVEAGLLVWDGRLAELRRHE